MKMFSYIMAGPEAQCLPASPLRAVPLRLPV